MPLLIVLIQLYISNGIPLILAAGFGFLWLVIILAREISSIWGS